MGPLNCLYAMPHLADSGRRVPIGDSVVSVVFLLSSRFVGCCVTTELVAQCASHSAVPGCESRLEVLYFVSFCFRSGDDTGTEHEVFRIRKKSQNVGPCALAVQGKDLRAV